MVLPEDNIDMFYPEDEGSLWVKIYRIKQPQISQNSCL